MAESRECASLVYTTRNLRVSKSPKEENRAQKKMRMTEVEKLQKDHDNTKKRKLRGSKEKAEKVADTKSKEVNDDNQQNLKGKKKKNMTVQVVQETEIDPKLKKGDHVWDKKISNAPVVQDTEDADFKMGDLVKLKGLEEGEDDKIVALGKVHNVAGATLHGKEIFPGSVCVEVLKSLDDNYGLFAPIDLDDPPVTMVGQALGHFVLWPTEFMDIDLSFSQAV